MSEFCSRSFQTPIRSPAPIPEKGDAEREVVAGLSIKLLQRSDELGIQMFQRHSLRHHGFTFVGNFFGFPGAPSRPLYFLSEGSQQFRQFLFERVAQLGYVGYVDDLLKSIHAGNLGTLDNDIVWQELG
jgi:hypothetical protein